MRALIALPTTLFLSALVLAPATAADWDTAPRVTVALSNFDFQPKLIHLHAGQPVVLHLVNNASGGHNFTAPEFFAASAPRPGLGALARGVELGGHETRDVALVPKAGHYPLKCTHAFHKAFGMKGEIVVD